MSGMMHALLAQLPAKTAMDLSLTWTEVGIAACLLAINALVSVVLKLGLAKQIALSSFRMTIQLAILGLVLKQIFELSIAAPVLGLAALMTIAAVSTAASAGSEWPRKSA